MTEKFVHEFYTMLALGVTAWIIMGLVILLMFHLDNVRNKKKERAKRRKPILVKGWDMPDNWRN